jgi:hypothetical protein
MRRRTCKPEILSSSPTSNIKKITLKLIIIHINLRFAGTSPVLNFCCCCCFFFPHAVRFESTRMDVDSTRIISLLNRHALRHTNPTALRVDSTRLFLLCNLVWNTNLSLILYARKSKIKKSVEYPTF